MSAQNVDISTNVLGQTAVKRGDFNAADNYVMGIFNKAAGASTAIRRGYALTQNNAVTPNVFAVTSGKAAGTVVISGLPYVIKPANINVTGAADGNGEDICAEDADISFQGIRRCANVVVKCSGTLQPGDQVMTAASGTFAKYDASGPQYIKGYYVGLPGSTHDGAYIKQGATDGQLVVIDFNGGS